MKEELFCLRPDFFYVDKIFSRKGQNSLGQVSFFLSPETRFPVDRDFSRLQQRFFVFPVRFFGVQQDFYRPARFYFCRPSSSIQEKKPPKSKNRGHYGRILRPQTLSAAIKIET